MDELEDEPSALIDARTAGALARGLITGGAPIVGAGGTTVLLHLSMRLPDAGRLGPIGIWDLRYAVPLNIQKAGKCVQM
jgi:hypothetical protein